MSVVVGQRFYSAVEDLFLCVEISTLFILWLGEWQRTYKNGYKNGTVSPNGSHKNGNKNYASLADAVVLPRWRRRRTAFYIAYGANLLMASLWTAVGTYIHMYEPLPTEPTTVWLLFLVLGVATPVIFPVMHGLAFSKEDPPSLWTAWLCGLLGLVYTLSAVTGADLSMGGLLPTEVWITPWTAIDGRSYAGAPGGFDLFSSMPCYRGDSMFILVTAFLISNFIGLIKLIGYARPNPNVVRTNDERKAAAILAGCSALMLVNSVMMLYQIVVFQWRLETALHIFHIGQGIMMPTATYQLREMLRAQSLKEI